MIIHFIQRLYEVKQVYKTQACYDLLMQFTLTERPDCRHKKFVGALTWRKAFFLESYFCAS